jgi:hypothetical protein
MEATLLRWYAASFAATDHTIRYRHFTLPPASELNRPGSFAKILLGTRKLEPDFTPSTSS